GFDMQFVQITQAQGWTPYQKYAALQQLQASIAQRIEADGTSTIANIQNYARQFSPDQGAAVGQLLANINGLTEANIKTSLQAEYAKVSTEMQNDLAASTTQTAAAQTAALQPGAQPATAGALPASTAAPAPILPPGI